MYWLNPQISYLLIKDVVTKIAIMSIITVLSSNMSNTHFFCDVANARQIHLSEKITTKFSAAVGR